MMSIKYRIFSDGLILIESKDEIRKRGLPSPDRLDAVVMVCADSGYLTSEQVKQKLESTKPVKGESKLPWKKEKNRERELTKMFEKEFAHMRLGKTIKGSKSQTYYPEDLGMESDMPTEK